MQGDWETLCSKFCLCLFPIYRVVSLRKEVLNFRQLEEESLAASWDHFNDLIITSPNLAIQDLVLLQHFYMGLARIPCNPLIKPLEELSFICLLVKEGLCLIELVKRLIALAFIMNSLSKRRNHLSNKKKF
jgi:hypothetical protein